MRALAPLLALAACATPADPDEAGLEGLDGKADSITGIPTKRRVMTHVPCPEGDAKAKVAFFDADSTLRVSKSGSVTANTKTDVNVLPFAAREIARLADEGYVIAVVSNQGGVSSGQQTFATAEGGLAYAVKQLARLGGKVDYFDFADKYDNYRKPNIGMAELLDSKLETKCGAGIDYAQSFMVGDSGYKKDVDGPHPDGRPADDFSNSDRLFAENLGVPFHEPTDFFGWREYDVFNIASQAELEALLDVIEPVDVDEATKNREVNGL